MSEPARSDDRILDVRVGSATNALQPVLAAERTFSAGPAQWHCSSSRPPRWPPTR